MPGYNVFKSRFVSRSALFIFTLVALIWDDSGEKEEIT